ncbi:MAG: prepilin-type N-terminal cleavage/methylation domain-containing protein [Candidatus Babeliales bacterium]|nr:prepilin-type N-terminal cleavage/methylation domain-containing protein [Candidatus Babeliales bacterium]
MIHSKNLNKGFTFTEVVIAIAVTGLILTSLFTLQTTMFNNIVNGHFKTARIFFMKNFLLDEANLKNVQQNKKPIEKKLEEPTMKLRYELKKPNEQSSLAKNFKNVSLVKVTGTWQGLRAEQEEMFVGLVYIKPEKKKT